MIDRNIISAKLVELDKRVRRVEVLRKGSITAYQDDDAAVELTAFNLMLAVQCASDLAAHLTGDQDWPAASTSAESFERLSEHGVIPAPLAGQLRKAVGFRNAAAHGYAQLRLDLLHAAATDGLADLVTFSQHVAQWVSQQA